MKNNVVFENLSHPECPLADRQKFWTHSPLSMLQNAMGDICRPGPLSWPSALWAVLRGRSGHRVPPFSCSRFMPSSLLGTSSCGCPESVLSPSRRNPNLHDCVSKRSQEVGVRQVMEKAEKISMDHCGKPGRMPTGEFEPCSKCCDCPPNRKEANPSAHLVRLPHPHRMSIASQALTCLSEPPGSFETEPMRENTQRKKAATSWESLPVAATELK